MNLNNLSDEELMALYKKGTEGAFDILYARHHQKVYGFICRKVADRELAADLYQEVFVRVHKSKHLYNENFDFLPWVFTVTKNLITDHARKKDVLRTSMEISEDLSIAAPEQPVWNTGFDVTTDLQKLNPTQKRALELRYLEEKTFQEISQSLNTSEVNARKIISRGLNALRELFDKKGAQDD